MICHARERMVAPGPSSAGARPAASSGQIVSSPRQCLRPPRPFLPAAGPRPGGAQAFQIAGEGRLCAEPAVPTSRCRHRLPSPIPGPCRAARLLCYADAHLTVPSRGALAMAHLILLLGMLIGMLASSPGAGAAPPVDRCFAVSQAPRHVEPVAFRRVVLQPNEVRLEFVGHSTWLIESAGGVEDRHRLQRLRAARRCCPTSPP